MPAATTPVPTATTPLVLDGPTVADSDRLADEFAELVGKQARRAGAEVAAGLREGAHADDAAAIVPAWRQRVSQTLAPTLGLLWHVGAADVRHRVQRHYGLTAAADRVAARVVKDLLQAATDEQLAESYLASAEEALAGAAVWVWAHIREQLIEGIHRREELHELRDRVHEATGMALPKAQQIARNEAHDALQYGAYAQVLASRMDGDKEWVAVMDDRTRDDHWNANGQRVPLRAKFTIGGWPADRPHDPALPAHEAVNCRCVPAGQVVSGLVTAAMARPFHGYVVQVSLASGRQFSATPEHPVLTASGWSPLQLIQEGDRVACATRPVDAAAGRPDVQHRPATAEEVFQAVALAAARGQRPRRAAMDLNGQRGHGEINVQVVDDPLPFNGHANLLQRLGQVCIAPSHREVGAAGHPAALGGVGEPLAIGVPHAAGVQAGVSEGVDDRAAVDPQVGRDAQHRIASLEPSHGVITERVPRRLPSTLTGFGSWPDDTATMQPAPNGARRMVDNAGDLMELAPGQVELDTVVDVGRRWYSGHVYDFQSTSGMLCAGDVIVHNCSLRFYTRVPDAQPPKVSLATIQRRQRADQRLLDRAYTRGVTRKGIDRKELLEIIQELKDYGQDVLTEKLLGKALEGPEAAAEAEAAEAAPEAVEGAATVEVLFNPGQARDRRGRWSPGGGSPGAGGRSLDDPAAAKAFLDQHYGQWKRDLTDAEYQGLAFYQSPGFALMNGQLRGLDKDQIKADMTFSDADLRRARKASSDLTRGIGKAPPLDEAIQVHRGFDAAQFGQLTPGARVTDRGFVSTSLTSSGIAAVGGRGGKPGVMRIELPAGTKAGAGSARELILPPGSSFEILGVREQGGTTVVDARLAGGG